MAEGLACGMGALRSLGGRRMATLSSSCNWSHNKSEIGRFILDSSSQ